MSISNVITPYADLDELLFELLGHWRKILGENLAGAYVQGSFALGTGDLNSDCDWIVATHRQLTEPQTAQLRELHDEIPTRDGHWCHDIGQARRTQPAHSSRMSSPSVRARSQRGLQGRTVGSSSDDSGSPEPPRNVQFESGRRGSRVRERRGGRNCTFLEGDVALLHRWTCN